MGIFHQDEEQGGMLEPPRCRSSLEFLAGWEQGTARLGGGTGDA